MTASEIHKEQLIKILIIKGISSEDAKIFLESNSFLYNYTPGEFNNKISIIFNGNDPYAIIFCDKNNLVWCPKSNGRFYEFVKRETKIDYIVQMMIGNAYRTKINTYSDGNPNDTLEDKMKAYRDISSGSPGYNLK